MKLVTLLLSLTISTGVLAQTQVKIPRKFQGEWNMQPAACGTALNDSVLLLESEKISYYETSGPVRAVLAHGHELGLLAELSGEGHTSIHAAQFRLSRDGRTLIDELSTPQLKRYRCPTRRR
jgi:hypothetical protein